METTPAVRLTLRLPAELHAALVALARAHDRSLHGELVAAVRAYAVRAARSSPATTRRGLPLLAGSSG